MANWMNRISDSWKFAILQDHNYRQNAIQYMYLTISIIPKLWHVPYAVSQCFKDAILVTTLLVQLELD